MQITNQLSISNYYTLPLSSTQNSEDSSFQEILSAKKAQTTSDTLELCAPVSTTDSKNAKWFDSVAPNAPASVKDAWDKATAVAGVSGLGITTDGSFSHATELLGLDSTKTLQAMYRAGLLGSNAAPQQMQNWLKNNADTLLGTTVESAKDACTEALYKLNNPTSGSSASATKEQQDKERTFYTEFLENLNEI